VGTRTDPALKPTVMAADHAQPGSDPAAQHGSYRRCSLAAAIAMIRRYVRKPSMPRMSDEWLLSRLPEFSRLDNY